MKKKKQYKSSKWQWYSVKLIFESIISSEPESNTIDINYISTHKTYEESIILINAQSFDYAYKIAEKKAIERELDYINVYGESVGWKFVEAIDCFSIGEETLNTGVELYSRFLRVPKNINSKEFIDRYCPETIRDDDGDDYNFILRNKDFNKRPNSDN